MAMQGDSTGTGSSGSGRGLSHSPGPRRPAPGVGAAPLGVPLGESYTAPLSETLAMLRKRGIGIGMGMGMGAQVGSGMGSGSSGREDQRVARATAPSIGQLVRDRGGDEGGSQDEGAQEDTQASTGNGTRSSSTTDGDGDGGGGFISRGIGNSSEGLGATRHTVSSDERHIPRPPAQHVEPPSSLREASMDSPTGAFSPLM